MLQQRLPFTVLKREENGLNVQAQNVATALTVYGIETEQLLCPQLEVDDSLQQRLPFTVLKLS